MLFRSRSLAGIVSLIISILVFCILIIFFDISILRVITICIILFITSVVVIYLFMKVLFFEEIEEVHGLLELIKKDEYTLDQKRKADKWNEENPLNILKKDIFDFAEKKKQEIDELKKLETFRREFLADVSHELKTPIFAAQGFVHTLIDGAIDDLEVRDRFLEKAANSLDNLNILVEDLLTISQLEIGEIKMQYQNFDLRKLVIIVFEQLEEAAKKRGTVLKIYKYSPKSCYVLADKHRIGQVLSNLVMNAIKYGKENGIVLVSFSVENNDVKVNVKDNGPGISSIHLKRIFERFYRVEKSRSRDKGGTGLGLAIVKHILEAHGSKIFVKSKVDVGTIFSFKLKLGRVINENG